MNQLFDKISEQYAKGSPFVSYRKPQEFLLKGYFPDSSQLQFVQTFEERGFVFVPFQEIEKSILFSESTSEYREQELEDNSTKVSSETQLGSVVLSDREKHVELVAKGVEAIHKGNFKKVVLSRKEVLKLSAFDLIATFKRLLASYPNAFVYVWFHPEVGLWMGATPERLVTLKENTFATMALASTQVYNGNLKPEWGAKEKEEHQYVVDYIVSQIKAPNNGIKLEDFKVSDTYTAKAGNLLHLKADIQGAIGDFNLKELLKALHPTPAVCGLPKKEAKEFILQQENYDRAYYTGFLGEMNISSKTELFVNLRCVEIQDKQAIIYVGGGITADSDAEKEWAETMAKSQTIKKVL